MTGSFPILLKDFIQLFIPSKCSSCGVSLHDYENFVCKECLLKLAKTNFLTNPKNAVSQIFWGRVSLETAFAFYYFSKGSSLQKLIHQIKYHGAKELAFELGKEMGHDLKENNIAKNIDVVTPVPLHTLKEKKRGYNQSDWIARGLAETSGLAYDKSVLKRTVYTTTQTKKTKDQRWENVKDAFAINKKQAIENKHVLVVDDVLTTGATLEACATKLLACKNTKVSMATLAFAFD